MTFESEFLPRLGRRKRSFGILFKHLRRRATKPGKLFVVETGCLRLCHGNLPWRAAGCSSLLFDAFAKEANIEFISIDNNKNQCAMTRKYCPRAVVLCGDSIKTLYELRKKIRRIDLLYLDSYDLDWRNPHPSALHHLQELCAAGPLLCSGSIVFIDDNTPEVGKGMYIRNYMEMIGAKQICEDYQIG